MLLTYKQALDSGLTKEDLETYYYDHTLEECEEHFSIGNKVITKLFKHYDIKKRSPSECKHFNDLRQSIIYDTKWLAKKEELEAYYRMHSGEECANYFNINKSLFYRLCRLLDIKLRDQSESSLLGIETFKKRYSVSTWNQREDYRYRHSHYMYDNIFFDSSWELSLYIYAKDHNEFIEREPVRFSYFDTRVSKTRYYYPDFKYKDKLLEIKDDRFVTNDGLLLDFRTYELNKDKTNCLAVNNVSIWIFKDVKFALDYCMHKFNNRSWYKQFKKN